MANNNGPTIQSRDVAFCKAHIHAHALLRGAMQLTLVYHIYPNAGPVWPAAKSVNPGVW